MTRTGKLLVRLGLTVLSLVPPLLRAAGERVEADAVEARKARLRRVLAEAQARYSNKS